MNFRKETAAKLLVVILLTVGVSACQEPLDDAVVSPSNSTEEVTPGMMTKVEGTLWKLVSYNQKPVLAGSEITLKLMDGKLDGSAGCNQYFANYQLAGEQLAVDAAGSTKKACEPQLMEQENTYLRLLQKTNNAIAATDNMMTIETSEGNLVFEAAK